MSKVNWSNVDHNDFERLVTVLVHRRHPRAQRLRASRGDEGIDILDPITPDAEEIYQVKSFAGALTSTRRNQIEKSFRRVVEARGARIRHWYLVMPMNPSPQGDEFFRELTKNAAFMCTWLGEAFLDSLASDYPEVIDYYLNNGKARLEGQLSDLSTILGLQQKMNSPEEPIRPAEIKDLLSGLLNAVDKADPHFRYEFQSAAHAPTREELLSKKGAVVNVSSWDGERSTTISVYLKYDAALEDRPIPIDFKVICIPGSSVASDLQEFLNYGLPVDLPLGTITDLRINLPGGLGVDGIAASGRLGHVAVGKTESTFLKLRLHDSTDAVLSELIIQLSEGSVGRRGGTAMTGKDLSGVVSVQLKSMPPGASTRASTGSTKIDLGVLELFDKPVNTVRGAIKFLNDLQVGNSLSFASFPSDQYFGPKMIIPADFTTMGDFDDLLALVDDLVLLQERVPWKILLPESLPTETANEVSLFARLLRGERVIRTWTEAAIHITPEGIERIETEFASPCTLMIESEMALNLPGGKVPLGTCTQHLYSATIGRPPEWDNLSHDYVCLLRPTTNNLLEIALGGGGTRPTT